MTDKMTLKLQINEFSDKYECFVIGGDVELVLDSLLFWSMCIDSVSDNHETVASERFYARLKNQLDDILKHMGVTV